MFSKIDVNGVNVYSFYVFFKNVKYGILINSIKWNFIKFLCDKYGIFVKRYLLIVLFFDIVKDIEKEFSKE